MDPGTALAARNVSKAFGATHALRSASLTLHGGEIHGLVGANGSGKSTMIKILSGIYVPDEGELTVGGRRIAFPVRRPTDIGIAVVHQRLGLIGEATVVDTVGAGVAYQHRAAWRISWRAERARCRALCERLGVDIDPDTRIADLPAAQRTVVAIMRALRNLQSTGDRHVLILDEPTVSMSPKEVAILERALRRLTDAGEAVLLVSHRLTEVLSLCARVTILRDGRDQGTYDSATLDEPAMLRHMLGQDPVAPQAVAAGGGPGSVALRARGLTGARLRDLDLDVGHGRIVGLTGLVGSGHDEFPYLVAGVTRAGAGTLTLDGAPLPGGVRARMRAGVSVVPGDRARQAMWGQARAVENISLPTLFDFFTGGRLSRGREERYARALMSEHDVRPAHPAAAMDTFSGGNQQKIVLGRALKTAPSVLVLHEPTVGVDANAKRQIYAMVRGSLTRGAAVVVCSTDYEELAEYCDRVVVIHEGRAVATLDGPGLTESVILAACNAKPAGQDESGGRSGPLTIHASEEDRT